MAAVVVGGLQAVFREKLWSVTGISAVVECLSCHDRDMGPKLCGVLCLASVMGGAKAKDLPFLLHYSQPGEDLLHLLQVGTRHTGWRSRQAGSRARHDGDMVPHAPVVTDLPVGMGGCAGVVPPQEDHSFHRDGRELIDLLTPLLELKPKPEEDKHKQQAVADGDEATGDDDLPPPPPPADDDEDVMPPIPPTPSGVADGTYDISDDEEEEDGGRALADELLEEEPPAQAEEEGGDDYPDLGDEDEGLGVEEEEEADHQQHAGEEEEGGAEDHVLAVPPQWVQVSQPASHPASSAITAQALLRLF